MDAQSDGGLRTNETVHQIWDSGLYPYGDTVSTVIYWLDDSTLLFMADKNPKPATPKDAPNRTPWLYLWRLGEKPRPLGEDPQEASRFYRAARGTVCFQQKKIEPATGKTSEVMMKGPPGQEQEAAPWNIRLPGVPLNGTPGNIEPIDCELFADTSMAGRVFTTDSYHRYYLDRADTYLPPAVGENPVLMKSDGSDRKVLPIPPEEVGVIYFRTFDNIFWTMEDPTGVALRSRGSPMIDGFQNWKAKNCLAVWRIDPISGATDRRCAPFGPWSGQMVDASNGVASMISLVPTAKGLFFTSKHYVDSVKEHAWPSGLYKLENSAPKRVLAGYMQHATPSPNGCRIAFVYGPNWITHEYGTPGSWTIAAIDVCSSG
jgi:hypothetical protein